MPITAAASPKTSTLELPPGHRTQPSIHRILTVGFTLIGGPSSLLYGVHDGPIKTKYPALFPEAAYHGRQGPTVKPDEECRQALIKQLSEWLCTILQEKMEREEVVFWDSIARDAGIQFGAVPRVEDLAAEGERIGFRYRLYGNPYEEGEKPAAQEGSILATDPASSPASGHRAPPPTMQMLLRISPTVTTRSNEVTPTPFNRIRSRKALRISTVGTRLFKTNDLGTYPSHEQAGATSPKHKSGIKRKQANSFTASQLAWIESHGPAGEFGVSEESWNQRAANFNREFGGVQTGSILFDQWKAAGYNVKSRAHIERVLKDRFLKANAHVLKAKTLKTAATPPLTQIPPIAAGFQFNHEHDKWLNLAVRWINDEHGKTHWTHVKSRFQRRFQQRVTVEDLQGHWAQLLVMKKKSLDVIKK